ncbi:MAG: hypothetical protein R3343_14865 [Nitriliruptorales bacterium]|nr:hypothetical protein [Nitriliruptorales bacterium]
MKRQLLITLAALPLAIGSIAATTVDDDSESTSEAEALNIQDEVIVSQTTATTEDDGEATATALEVGGETVSGGSQEGEGSSSGELVGTGDTELGSASVAPWEAEVDEDGNAESEAHLARVTIVDEDTAYIELVSSRSSATNDGSEAESSAATIDLGDGELHAELLRAYTNSEGEGDSFLVSLNGNEIGSDEQFDGGCELPADPLLRLSCVYADETGEGAISVSEDGSAGVIDLAALDDNVQADGFQAAASSSQDDTEVLSGTQTREDADEPAPASSSRGELPFTGGGLGLGLMGLAALLSGEGLRRFRG